MSKLRRWLQSFRKFLSAVWYFCPLYFIIGGWMLCIVVLTLIHINGYLTANQFAIGMIAGVIALICFLLGFMGICKGETESTSELAKVFVGLLINLAVMVGLIFYVRWAYGKKGRS